MSLNLSTSSSLDDTFRIHRESLSNRIKTTAHRSSIRHTHRSPPQSIILMISDSDQAYSERTLTPPTHGQPILIGRATVIDKQTSSILTQPAPDNARFTCPVMSKTHAQITWKNDLPYLQDTKSTHGTWYRGEQDIFDSDPRAQTSSRNVPRASWERIPPILQLQDGMSIRFGRAITNPSSGSRYTPLEVTVRIPKPTGASQSGTYGLIDPYLTFSDDSESEKPCMTSLPKTSITNLKKGSSQSQAPLQGLADHSRPVATETNTSLKADPIKSTFQTSDSPAASNLLLSTTGNSKLVRHKIASSQASSTDTLGSLAKPNVFNAVMAKGSTSSDQPVGSKLLPRAAPSDHPTAAVDQTLHERIPSSKSSINEAPRSPVKSRIDQAGATGYQSLPQHATELNTSTNYSYPNHRPSSSNSIHLATPPIISSLSPAKSSTKKASLGSIHSNNRASKSRVGSGKGEEPDDRKEAVDIRACAKRLNIKKVNATEPLDDTEQNNRETHTANYEQSNDLETRGRIPARQNEPDGRDIGIGEIDCDSKRTGSDSEENSSHMDEEPDHEDEDSDSESKNSNIEDESSHHVDGDDVDEEQDEFEEADSDTDGSAAYERDASGTTDDESTNDSVDHVESVGPSKDLQNSGKNEPSRSNTEEDDEVNSCSASESPSSLPSPRQNKDSIVNITKKTASSKTFRDMSVVTTITSKTHFTESLNRLPENSVQVSFKLEPICLSPSHSILTEDHVSSRMPLDPIVPRKSPKIVGLVEPKAQDALESASAENSKPDRNGRLIPIVDGTVCTSSRLKRKRSVESVGQGEETGKNVTVHKKKLIKKSIAGGAICSHCSNELPQPKKQRLSAHVLSAARSLFIFALGGAATVAGILAFENIIDEI